MAHESIGERLRRARESIPASLYQASRETKIRVDFLEYMERDNFRFLSGGTYLKGLLRGYGRWLGLDEDELISNFERVYGSRPGPSLREILKKPAQRPPRSRRRRWVIAAAAAASILVGLSFVGLMQPAGPKIARPPSPAEAARGPGSGGSDVAVLPSRIQGVRLTVNVIGERSWLRVLADRNESPIFQGTLFEGASKTFEAKEVLTVTFGDLGAVSVVMNGKDLGIPGAPGQVGTFQFSPATTSFTRG